MTDVGRVITGSSNLTQAGLVDNLEFNVDLSDQMITSLPLISSTNSGLARLTLAKNILKRLKPKHG